MSFIGTAKDLFVQSLQLRADLHAAHIHGPRVPGGLRHHTGALFGIFAVMRDITDSVFGIEQHSTEQHQLDAVQAVLQQ